MAFQNNCIIFQLLREPWINLWSSKSWQIVLNHLQNIKEASPGCWESTQAITHLIQNTESQESLILVFNLCLFCYLPWASFFNYLAFSFFNQYNHQKSIQYYCRISQSVLCGVLNVGLRRKRRKMTWSSTFGYIAYNMLLLEI